MVCTWELRRGRLTPRVVVAPAGVTAPRLLELPRSFGILGRALDAAPGDAVVADGGDRATLTVLPGPRSELAAAIPGPDGPWGVLLVVPETTTSPVRRPRSRRRTRRGDRHDRQRRAAARTRSPTCSTGRRRYGAWPATSAAGSISTGSCPGSSTTRWCCSRATAPRSSCGARTAGPWRRSAAGCRRVPVGRAGLPGALPAGRRGRRPTPLFAVGYRDDPRGAGVRAAVVQEGFDTICTAPLMDGTEILGLLNVYHDTPHAWTPDELETIAALATQASVAIRTAQNFQQMATWTAQLQSIQQLGARLNHLSSVRDIGLAIATELRQLIDYHNVRVYRLVGDGPHARRDAGPGR